MSKVLLEKLIVTQSINSLPFMEPKTLLQCPHEPHSVHYSELDKSCLQLPTTFL